MDIESPHPPETRHADALRVPAPRLRDAVAALAQRVAEPEVRAQLHALAGILAVVDGPPPDGAAAAEIDAGIARGDEPAVVAAMTRLAALERDRVPTVDWTRASGG